MLAKFLFLVITVQTVICQHESAKRCARAAGACLLAPEATEGPFYWNSTVRQDITEGRPGFSLRLAITVLDTRTCLPVPSAVVDLWHCDSAGLYSHFMASSQMGGPTDGSTFFRGQQVTNSQGIATFNTIYPGWYPGRATHMLIKVHIGSSLVNLGGAIHVIGGHVSHTGQFFFDDTLTDAVATFPPYSSHPIQRTRNNEDFVYLQSNGATMLVPITFVTNMFTGGMVGEMNVGIDPTATPVEEGGGFGPRPPTAH
jgi:protocatechuate 3,4-dioxygenase beta subunit